MKKLVLGLMLFLLSSCQTTEGIFLHEVNASASDTRKAIVAVIGQPRNTSANGRVLTSRYHDKKGTFFDEIKSTDERRYTRITIQGDRRPFEVQVEVIIDKKNIEGRYEPTLTDNAQAREMANKLKNALHQSLDKRNIIDDFRAF